MKPPRHRWAWQQKIRRARRRLHRRVDLMAAVALADLHELVAQECFFGGYPLPENHELRPA